MQELWVEKYRPKRVEGCILPERIKSIFAAMVRNQSIPNLLLSGKPGMGKTTIAIAMCEEIGLDYMMINSSEERGIDVLRTKIRNFASTKSFGGKRKVIILDEADNLTGDTQAGLRGAIEEFSGNCTFILTCNFRSKLIEALHSRSQVINFDLTNDEKPDMANQFYHRLVQILRQENVPFEKAALIQIVKKHFPDYRRTLNEVQKFAQVGAIDASIMEQLENLENMSDLYDAMKTKNFTKMRKWVTQNSDVDMATIARHIYDHMNDHIEKTTIPIAILILAKYQYQHAFVADAEINLAACLMELMLECQWT